MNIRATASLGDILTTLNNAQFSEKQPITYSVGDTGSDWRVYAKASDEGVLRIAYVSDSCELLAKDTFASSSEIPTNQILKDMLTRYEEHRKRLDLISTDAAPVYGWALGLSGFAGLIALRAPGIVAGIATGLAAASGIQHMRTQIEDRKIAGYLKERGMYIGDNAMNYIKSFEIKPR